MQMFEKFGKIGEGTHGSVFKARNKVTKEIVAIKPFGMEEELGIPTSALREVCMLKQLQHPNIIKLLDVVCENTASKRSLPLLIILVYEHCEQDLKHYCDAVSASRKKLKPSVIRLLQKYVMFVNRLCGMGSNVFHLKNFHLFPT